MCVCIYIYKCIYKHIDTHLFLKRNLPTAFVVGRIMLAHSPPKMPMPWSPDLCYAVEGFIHGIKIKNMEGEDVVLSLMMLHYLGGLSLIKRVPERGEHKSEAAICDVRRTWIHYCWFYRERKGGLKPRNLAVTHSSILAWKIPWTEEPFWFSFFLSYL